MMKQYVDKGDTLGGFRCVTLQGSPLDKTLAGERGEIWETASGTYKALIVDRSENEKIIRFNEKDLAKWILKLKVPSEPLAQAHWANSPNTR